MSTYTISKEDTMLIYGAAYYGRDILMHLLSMGYRVDAFLDKRAEELNSVQELRCYLPENYPKDRSKCVVIIATSNPGSVAENLYKLGYCKLIYNAYGGKQERSLKVIGDAFEAIVQERSIPSDLPFYVTSMNERFQNGAFIREENSRVIACVPADLLFVTDNNSYQHLYAKYAELLRYIKAFDLQEESEISVINEYSELPEFEKTIGSKSTLSPEERRTYTQSRINYFSMRLQEDPEWFSAHPIMIDFHEKKFIVQDSCLFQLFFLISRGIQRIPASFAKEAYEYWINEELLSPVLSYVKSHDLPFSYTMLEHPFLYSFPAARDLGCNPRMLSICDYLYKRNISVAGKKMIDIGSYYGFLSRFFRRLGAEVTSVEYVREAFEAGRLFNRLLHCGDVESIFGGAQDLNRPNEFEFAVMLTVLYWHLDNEIGVKLIQAVDRMTTGFLIWESGDQPEKEKQFIFSHSGFSYYEKIRNTVGTGKIRELGVFYKNGR